MDGHLYSATFNALLARGGNILDAFELTTAATCRALVTEIYLGQYSDAGDTESEMLPVSVIYGHANSGTGGSSVTPSPGNPLLRAAVSTVEKGNSDLASLANGGSPTTIWSHTFNVRGSWWWRPRHLAIPDVGPPGILMAPSSRLVVRVGAPADNLTMNGTLVFHEQAIAPV